MVWARTLDHPVITVLEKEGITFSSFDDVYEGEDVFESVYEKIAGILLEKSREMGKVVYAVPGHPMLAEKTVQLLLEQEDVSVTVAGGQSYLDALFTSLQIDPIDGFQFVDATNFQRSELNYRTNIVFCQVYDAFVASDVKLTLLEDLPASYEVTVIEAAGSALEKKVTVPLEDLDRVMEISNLTSVYIPAAPAGLLHHTFGSLREVIHILRAPGGCPWDQAQTHETLKEYAIEEIYELIDAIDEKDDAGMIEELGDVLLQVMLHSQIGEDEGYFTIDDVIQSVTDKMVHRHPHVFTPESGEQKDWDALKQEEKGKKVRKSLLSGIAKSLPALSKAYQLQKRAAKVGFDWENATDIWDKLEEEIREVKEAVDNGNVKEIEKEFGDILFVLANLTRYYKINPEFALHTSNQKFISRFNYIEQQVKARERSLQETSLEEMDKYWDEAKERE
ncbi:nucleoside triphosphate pyrophosphohydrolase [Virgibacillus halophilus]|uniref:Nucleoside triphosphate pyrophosphohydrolase n=1 Tax=Tigheibacillus halophilus TaxID=361280 RepID=A0ABU5C8F6_9BACI|nr:nucleoside triphosphate pyrophosphohydrolase [Virgibacillus halophilus]